MEFRNFVGKGGDGDEPRRVPVAQAAAAWAAERERFAETGKWPLLLDFENSDVETDPEWEVTLQQAATHSPQCYFDAWKDNDVEYLGADSLEMEPEVDPNPPDTIEVSPTLEYLIDERPEKELTLLLLPVDEPAQFLQHVTFGGWNQCPEPPAILSVLRYWEKKYGAVPFLLGDDVLELWVPEPVRDAQAATQLAQEHYYFCQDRVWQGSETMEQLIEDLRSNSIWYFWWD